MRRLIFTVALLIAMTVPALAERPAVDIRPVERDFFRTEPRRVVTVVLKVINNTNIRREFIPEVNLPGKWQLITAQLPFELNAGETSIKLVSLFVPHAALAGTYDITYSVRDRDIPSLSRMYETTIEVLPMAKLSVKLIKAPERVIAGEDYRVSFIVINESNIEVTAVINIQSGEDIPYISDKESIYLAPGESSPVEVTVHTAAKIIKSLRHRLQLKASTVKNRSPGSKAVSIVEVIPSTSGKSYPYHRIPSVLSLSYAGSSNGDSMSGFQAEISGNGTLDEQGKKHIRYRFRGPDNHDESIFGMHDEYFLSYWTKDSEFHIGDRSYSLSLLTEKYIYGRGLEGRFKLNKTDIGAYYMKTRWRDPEEEQLAAYLNYQIHTKHNIGINYLSNKSSSDSQIISLRTQSGFARMGIIEAEAAIDEHDNAFYLKSSGSTDRISYYLNYIHAGPDFSGYHSDKKFGSASLFFDINKNVTLNSTIRAEKYNIDLDPALGSAQFEKYHSLGLEYTFRTGTVLSADYIGRTLEDRLPLPVFDYKENTFRLGVRHSFDKLSFQSSVESGNIDDSLKDDRSGLQRYTLAALYTPNYRQYHNAHIRYTRDHNFNDQEGKQLQAGISSMFRLSERTSLDLKYQNDYSETNDDRTQHLFDFGASHTFPNKHSLSLRGRLTWFSFEGQEEKSAYIIKYSVPFGMPVGRSVKTGVIKGNVYNEETMEAVSNAVLRLNGYAAVTDRNGDFIFRSIRPGKYYISVDRTGLGMNNITSRVTPVEVFVKGGHTSLIDLGITRASRLTGRITVRPPETRHVIKDKDNMHYIAGDNNSDYPEEAKDDYGLANTLVELSSGHEKLRRMTDTNGSFEFKEIRPGKWTLIIYKDNFPAYHYLEKNNIEIELSPGEEKEITQEVFLKKRRIQFIEEVIDVLEDKVFIKKRRNQFIEEVIDLLENAGHL